MTPQEILETNPILKSPELGSGLARWQKIRDAVEAAHPNLNPMRQAEIIGKVIERLEGSGQ
mgnify:FL=1|tara:strand:- start:2829 stop:3011 length:183 start_codon:yes stop_codon:yes gene_type:complete